MAPKAEGMWPCTVLGATRGEDGGQIVVRINVKIDDGPDKGKLATYEDAVNPKSSIYIARSCRAVGWSGRTLDTLAEDVAAWVKATGGKSTVEIKHILIKKGKKYDKWVEDGRRGDQPVWDKVQSLGRGPKPLAEPTPTAKNDADDYMRQALADDGVQVPDEPPLDDVPHAAANPDDLPF